MILKKILVYCYKYIKYYKLLSIIDIFSLIHSKRRVKGKVFLYGKQIIYPDAYWFLHSIDEIFISKVYEADTKKLNPFIIDCGSNIGLSIIFFKRKFLNAEIVAFEPDPQLYEMSVSNIKNSGLGENITVINKAVWIKNTIMPFNAEGTLGGTLIDVRQDASNSINVCCIDILSLLTRKIDFLKIDVEGSELLLLEHCWSKLYLVENMFVEFHGNINKPQQLDRFLQLISQAGFKYYIKESYNLLSYPFMKEYPKYATYDLLLNIFCFRINE